MVALDVTEGSLMKVVIMRWWGTLIRQKTHYTIKHISHKLLYFLSFLGLRLNLNIETNEYVADYMDAFGLRLVIHEPGTFPFPEEEGFTLNPRYETTIGMRLVSFDIFLLLFISSLYIFMLPHAKLNLFEVYHLIKIKIPKNVFEYRDFF